MADASFPAMRARSRPGMAIAEMMPMIMITSNSSMRVNPSFPGIFFTDTSITHSPETNTERSTYGPLSMSSRRLCLLENRRAGHRRRDHDTGEVLIDGAAVVGRERARAGLARGRRRRRGVIGRLRRRVVAGRRRRQDGNRARAGREVQCVPALH